MYTNNIFDETDDRILKELRRDPRISLSDIAKKVGIHRATVKKRVDNLIKKKYVQFFTDVCFEHPDIGWQLAWMCLKFESGVSESKKLATIHKLKSIEQVYSITETVGSYDLVIAVHYKTNKDLGTLQSQFKSFGCFSGEMCLLPIAKTHKFLGMSES